MFDVRCSMFPRRRHGFTLIEIMVVVVLMSVIVIGLMAMFSQTQRAFRAGMTQTDVLEGGRTATEMISRELEQITPAFVRPYSVGGNLYVSATNFYVALADSFDQPLTASNNSRTNILDEVFFLVHENQTWTGIGYFLRPTVTASGVAGPVGTLYRFQLDNAATQFTTNAAQMVSAFRQAIVNLNAPGTSKILDGVINFKLRAFDTDGRWMIYNHLANMGTNSFQMWTNGTVILRPASFNSLVKGETAETYFTSNAVPAFVEFELGILEQNTYERYKSIPVYDAQTNFLARQAGRLHLFRQRVAVRNVDRSAY